MKRRATIICLAGAMLLQVFSVKAQSPEMKKADSLYFAQDWVGAKGLYDKILPDTSSNSIAWNRVGFSNYNTGNYADALKDYRKALTNKPIPPVKASAYSRMARINAMQNNAGAAVSNIDSAIVYAGNGDDH